jgi:glucosamine--fructose-6-phosphate aminotransferase (isomerizing)
MTDNVTPKYHMLDYIHEAPESLKLTLEANEDLIERVGERVRRGEFQRIIMTAIGSSYTASVMAAPLFGFYSPVPIQVVESSEFSGLPSRLVNEKTLVIATSRSGERELVSDSLKEAVQKRAYGVAVTGVEDSLLAQHADLTIITREGPEITFPKTKSVVVCAGVLMRLALALGPPDDTTVNRRLLELKDMPAVLERTLEQVESDLQALLPTIQKSNLVAITGSGGIYGVALEAAIKVQEASCIPSYGYRTSAFLNGPVCAMSPEWLVICLMADKDKFLSQKVVGISRGRGACTLCIVQSGLVIGVRSDYCLTLPAKVDDLLAALVYLAPMQLLAYSLTVARGMNPDTPPSMNSILEAVLARGREEPEFRKELTQRPGPYNTKGTKVNAHARSNPTGEQNSING